MALTPQNERFILHFGEMGSRWGVNRTVGQIYALLFLSPKPLNADDIADVADFKEQVKLVFVSYGSREVGGGNRRGGFGGDPQANVEAIKAAGVNAHYYVSPETAHEWQSWRRSLREFAPLLFQD